MTGEAHGLTKDQAIEIAKMATQQYLQLARYPASLAALDVAAAAAEAEVGGKKGEGDEDDEMADPKRRRSGEAGSA